MENQHTESDGKSTEGTKSPVKSKDKPESLEVSETESNKSDAKESVANKPTQNGESDEKTLEKSEKSEKDANSEELNSADAPEKSTRGTKRKASEVVNATETPSNDKAEQKENVDAKNSENTPNDSQSADDSMKSVSDKDIMGKGKRARIPNKRYSDILLTPNRKSLGHSKTAESGDSEEVVIKEEPVDVSFVGTVSSPSLPLKKQRISLPKENLQDPKFLKPFKYGWKRELVWRSTSTMTKRVGDIYYYTPVGKKVRSFRELSDYLPSSNKNLTLDNFSFTKEPLGIDDPEKEIIRDAKVKSSDSFSESPVPKRVEIVKKPKKVLSPKSGGAETPTKPDVTITRSKVETPKNLGNTSKKLKIMPKRGKTPVAKKAKLSIKSEEPMEIEPSPVRSATKTNKPCQPCSIRCEGVQGVVPTLQCRLCLCLYHHECVGLSPNLNFPYICKNCHIEQGQKPNQSTTIVAPPPLTPINTLKSVTTPLSTVLPKLQRIPRPDSSDPVPVLQPLQTLPPLVEVPRPAPAALPARSELPKLTPKPVQAQEGQGEGNKSIVGAVTSWLPHNVKIVNSEEPTEVPRPQYLEYLGGRKFLVIPKHNFMSVSSSTPSLRAEESLAAAAVPGALQPTEIPTASASLGPSTVFPPQTTQNTPPDPPDINPEVKKEPLSPIKGDGSAETVEAMDVDPTQKSVDSVDGTSQGRELIGEVKGDDEVNSNSVSKQLKKRNLKLRSITNTNSTSSEEKNEAKFMENYLQNLSFGYNTLLYVFQYLKVQDLLRAGCVCTMWRDIASHPILWRTVRMKNSQVHSFEGLANTLKKHGTVHLDLRKMLLPSSGDEIWPEFSKAIEKVDTLRKIELCRCPATVVEKLAVTNPSLEVINAVTIKCESMDLDPIKSLTKVRELRLKSTSGLNISSIDSLKELKTLKHLSLTSVIDLHKLDLNVIAELTSLESLDIGECSDFPGNFGQDILSKLRNLEKLRLEKGQGNCHTFEILDAVKDMKSLEQLELVNFDVKAGFDKALGSCTNIKKLMIIPTYISQSATTNNMVLAGVLRLQGSLTHFVWGVTLELLRVTELFVDQCEEPKEKREKKPTGNGDSIPVLKPVPDLSHSSIIQAASNPPQVEILPLPNLQKLLLNSLPTTRVKILKIPFHATWRQTLTDSV